MPGLKQGLFFLVLSFLILWESLRLGLGTLSEPGPGFVSFCAGIPFSILSIIFIRKGGHLRPSPKPHSLRLILALLSLFAYSFALNILGFVIATFFFVAILFRLGEARRWSVILGTSAFVAFLSYVVFGVLLQVYFPRGFLGI